MTSNRFRQIRDIFETALDHSPDSRGAFLADACAGDESLRQEVEELLAAHAEANGALDIPAIARKMGVEPPQLEGSLIGPYEILRQLGRGGMGTVYLCRRTDGAPPKLVALKILRSDYASEDLLRRFEQERRILASLDHPNIARILDGGTTPDGLPFHVMEYVDGESIDRYCDRHQLDVEARLALFQQVCAAVAAAQANSIVHRDIKPTNILVTRDGVVKLLDFGIAKRLRLGEDDTTLWLTRTGLRPMTPEYASPEQIQEGEVTRATDVYSLGVVLYEVLTGHRPYRLKNRVFHEVLRVVCEEDPTLPSLAISTPPDAPGIKPKTDPETIARLRQTNISDLRKQLSGDLDGIVLKALRKEARHRYASAAELNDAIRRHREGLPVEAGSGRYYRFAKTLNRNRGWLMLALFLITAIAVGGIHVTWLALWLGMGAMAIWASLQVVGDRQLSRKVADGPFWPALTGVVIAAFYVSVIGPDFVNGFLKGFIDGRAGSQLSPPKFDPRWDAASWITLSWCVLFGLLVLKWLFRGRWGGRLVLDASSRRNRVFGAIALISLVYFLIEVWSLASGAARTDILARSLFLGVVDIFLWVFLYILSGRVEFRQFGVQTAAAFYSWRNIEAYDWDASIDGRNLLNLIMRGRHPILPAVHIKIGQGKRPRVDALLTGFLSDWTPRAFAGPDSQTEVIAR
ncbi:MAG TPA: serine/threonine-protein kinase [Blastocatellia bacterium]